MSDFKELVVWKKAMHLTKGVYAYSKILPEEEKFGLVSQIRRCAVSIPSNISEGSKRRTKKDFLQFLYIAMGSAAELETQLLLTKDLYEIDTEKLLEDVTEVQRLLQGLIRSF